MTEAEIVGSAMPSLMGEPGKATGVTEVEGGKKRKDEKDLELSVEEVKALRTLVVESSVQLEKTVLAQLKAELKQAPTLEPEAAKAKVQAMPDKGPGPGPAAAAGAPAGAGGATTLSPEATQAAFAAMAAAAAAARKVDVPPAVKVRGPGAQRRRAVEFESRGSGS